ncbi:MAG: ADP-ribose pyrophosphatase, partial [Saccharopolyspora rectivirgula]
RIFLARGLSETGRPEATGDEEADLVIHRVPFDEALGMVFTGEIVNAPAVTGLLAAQAVRSGAASPRSPQAEWTDRPRAMARRLHG